MMRGDSSRFIMMQGSTNCGRRSTGRFNNLKQFRCIAGRCGEIDRKFRRLFISWQSGYWVVWTNYWNRDLNF